MHRSISLCRVHTHAGPAGEGADPSPVRTARPLCRAHRYADTDEPVAWAFDRDLLAQGILRPSGEGDVRHWPTHTGPDAVLSLVLSPPHGAAHLTASLAVVTHWLERTYHLVPSGREGDGIDLNAELSRLLHGTA
ncbi:SsgA family sporulation/cell division regulator [Streptomyces mirabilis]|uniref:SsgA family sporulation/cell division regulator n=1 Tax=Streptomyces mirabilis TaxID=68239 RepID=UPI00365825CD